MGRYFVSIPVKFCPKFTPAQYLHHQSWVRAQQIRDGIKLKLATSGLWEYQAFLALERGCSIDLCSTVFGIFVVFKGKETQTRHIECVSWLKPELSQQSDDAAGQNEACWALSRGCQARQGHSNIKNATGIHARAQKSQKENYWRL